ncbi:MAG: hypothetical protein K0S66_1604 [Sphingomonas sp.]|jgi:hypothetical protein|nr:hypothetical protein [Sphingomonas sp.]
MSSRSDLVRPVRRAGSLMGEAIDGAGRVSPRGVRETIW